MISSMEKDLPHCAPCVLYVFGVDPVDFLEEGSEGV